MAIGAENALNLQKHLPHLPNPLLIRRHAAGLRRGAVYEKVKKIVEEGKSRSSLTLNGFKKEVEVDGKKHVMKVIDGSAELKKGKSLLRIKITAEVDGATRKCKITYCRHRIDAAEGVAFAGVNAPGGR